MLAVLGTFACGTLAVEALHPRDRFWGQGCANFTWPVGQAVKTSPFHGGNMGSIPVRVTTLNLNRTLYKVTV